MARSLMLAVLLAGLLACPGLAARDADAQPWRFHYPEPPASAIRITRDVPFGATDTARLLMDVYRPAADAGARPAVVLYALSWAGERPARAANDHLTSWARLLAAKGLVAVVPDLRGEPGTGNATTPARALGDDLERLLAHLGARARAYGIDTARLALFAASGRVSAALPAVEDPRQTAIRAAVFYYGFADVATLRLDLPVLLVRAGLDSRGINSGIDRLVTRALAQNAPLMLLSHHTGHHGFETADDDVATRDIIEQTLAFIERATRPAYQETIRARRLDVLAATQLSGENYRDAAQTLAELVRQRPTDGRVRFSYAQALLGDRQYVAACTEFRRATPPSFAAIVPGTRACVLAGAADSVVRWLGTVRRDWMQSEHLRVLHTDSTFAPLWGRPEFQALFRR